MSVLHIINRSPFESSALDSCQRLYRPGSAVLLIEDAVVAAVVGSAAQARLAPLADAAVLYVLMPDLRARGFADGALMPGAQPLDYGGFVDLAAAHDSSLSWS